MKEKDIIKIREKLLDAQTSSKEDLKFKLFSLLDNYYRENPDEFLKDIKGIDISKFADVKDIPIGEVNTCYYTRMEEI